VIQVNEGFSDRKVRPVPLPQRFSNSFETHRIFYA
jgi:hypothetical protein